MASRLLCFVLFLVLGVVPTYTKRTATNDDVDETAKLEKLTKEMFEMKEKEKRLGEEEKEKRLGEEEKHLTEDIHVKRTLFQRIAELAEQLIPECNRSVNLTGRLSRETSLRRYYNALQDGNVNFISAETLVSVLRSEQCSACALDLLCQNASIQRSLNIPYSWPRARRERVCVNRIIRMDQRTNSPNPNFERPECDPNAEFRTIDGTCNNLDNPEFGAHATEFIRLVVPQYADGISAPRISVTGNDLPNARLVSRDVHGSNADRTNPNSRVLTHFTMNFGQFMDHDITLAEEQGINCEPPTYNPECFNIDVPEDDFTFRTRGIDSFELERNAPAEQGSFCRVTPRQHVNEITAFIDASNVYGSVDDVADVLRTSDGLLKVMKHPFSCDLKKLMPAQPPESFCVSRNPNKPCFMSGDIRNNENAGLNSVHTIFVRQHNRIASFFVKNTDWDGERIYQVTRKIVGAQLQIITYGEFLTLVLSDENIDRFGLRLLRGRQFFTGYDRTVNAQMTAAFSVAAYRFGHTLIQEEFSRFSQGQFEHRCDKCHGGNQNFLPIAVLDFGNPTYLYDVLSGGVDSILTGLIKDPAGKIDKKFSSSVQENLSRGEGDLSDLIAINIQRGRERGVAPFLIYRNLVTVCNLTRVTSFEELETVAGFLAADVDNLRLVYRSVWDIDLFTGGLCEPATGGLLGPTFQCIISEQFRRLRIGDRFWHENEPSPLLYTDNIAFTACQLSQLRNTRMSEIVAANSDAITSVPRNAFEQSEVRIPFSMLPKVDLRPWLDDFVCPNSAVSGDEEKTEW